MTATTDIKAPTCGELNDEDGVEQVYRHSDASWRHGTRETVVFRRESDGTFWRARFRLSTDGETNELRDGDAKISRVYPHTVTAIEYRDTPATEVAP